MAEILGTVTILSQGPLAHSTPSLSTRDNQPTIDHKLLVCYHTMININPVVWPPLYIVTNTTPLPPTKKIFTPLCVNIYTSIGNNQIMFRVLFRKKK
jgi:hypothetical protein